MTIVLSYPTETLVGVTLRFSEIDLAAAVLWGRKNALHYEMTGNVSGLLFAAHVNKIIEGEVIQTLSDHPDDHKNQQELKRK